MKPSKYIKYDLIERNLFLKSPRHMEVFLVIIYTQVKKSEWRDKEIIDVQMYIVCDTKMNDHMHNMIIC